MVRDNYSFTQIHYNNLCLVKKKKKTWSPPSSYVFYFFLLLVEDFYLPFNDLIVKE